MDPAIAGAVLVAALLHAVWNALVKASSDQPLAFALISATGGVIGLVAAVILPPPPVAAWGWLVASVALHNLYFAALLAAYRIGDLSLVYPIARGLAPLGVVAAAAAIADERPSLAGLAGIAVASAGILLLTAPANGAARSPADLRAIAWSGLIAAMIAGYTVVDGGGVRAAAAMGVAPWSYIAWLHLLNAVAFVPVMALWYRRGWPVVTPANLGSGIGAGAILVASYAIVLYALGTTAMGYVSALRESSVVFAAVIGAVALGENFGRRRVIAAAAIALGLGTMTLTG